jgi:predicted transcriptional regulator
MDMKELVREFFNTYISTKDLTPDDFFDVIRKSENIINKLVNGDDRDDKQTPTQVPAVPIDESVTDEYLVSLEDGKKLKSLKKHLSTYGMTPNDYRRKWKLDPDYPMTCKNYSKLRQDIAFQRQLGCKKPTDNHTENEASVKNLQENTAQYTNDLA